MAYNYEKLKSSLQKKRRYLTITILISMVIILIFGRSLISDYSNYFLSLIYKPYNSLINNTYHIIDMVGNLNNLYNENTILKENNVTLLQKNANLEYLREENVQLKKLLVYTDQNPTQKYITAAVYAQDPLNLSNLLTIDKGSNDKITIGQHVVYNGIYLGQVIAVNKYNSQVKLITDPTLSIVGQIPSINSNGIVHGQIGFGMIMEDIPPDAALSIGQLVTTSAIDANMPDNLILGEIIEVIKSDQNIFQQAIIKPYYQPIDLKYVLVYINEQN